MILLYIGKNVERRQCKGASSICPSSVKLYKDCLYFWQPLHYLLSLFLKNVDSLPLVLFVFFHFGEINKMSMFRTIGFSFDPSFLFLNNHHKWIVDSNTKKIDIYVGDYPFIRPKHKYSCDMHSITSSFSRLWDVHMRNESLVDC